MPDLYIGAQRIRFNDNRVNGPAIVFCHSFAMDGSMFKPQVEHFSKTYRCITWDQRGHGSSFTDSAFTFWDSANDAIALLDHIGVDRATFVGTSQGGFVSLRAALAARQRVAGVVVLGSSSTKERLTQRLRYRALGLALRTARASGLPQFPLSVMRDICFGPAFEGAAPWLARWKLWPSPQFTRALDALVSRDEITQRLHEIKAPSLVLHGTADAAYGLDVAKSIVDNLGNCRDYVVVEGGSHFLSITDPAPVNAAMRVFLETVN